VLCLVLIIVMAGTTFLTQRQMMARNGPMEGTAAQTQKIMLYIFPLSFFIYGFVFPIGVLLYWVTSNIFTMGQQFLVIHRMDAGAPASAPPSGPSGPAPGAKPKVPPRGPGQKPAQKPPPAPAPKPAADQTGSAKPSRSTADIVLPPGGAIGGLMGAPPTGGSPKPKPPNRPNPNRSKKKKRRGR
jgi:YidC/Oxa1 family membrane protein insertase